LETGYSFLISIFDSKTCPSAGVISVWIGVEVAVRIVCSTSDSGSTGTVG